MRRLRRTSRKANPEALDKAGNAAHVHVERIAFAQRCEPLRIRGSTDQLCPQLAKIVLESSRRYDFQNPGWRVAGIPERVPLFARLENQVPGIANDHGISEQRPDTPL